jgi:hypothetical protein
MSELLTRHFGRVTVERVPPESLLVWVQNNITSDSMIFLDISSGDQILIALNVENKLTNLYGVSASTLDLFVNNCALTKKQSYLAVTCKLRHLFSL